MDAKVLDLGNVVIRRVRAGFVQIPGIVFTAAAITESMESIDAPCTEWDCQIVECDWS